MRLVTRSGHRLVLLLAVLAAWAWAAPRLWAAEHESAEHAAGHGAEAHKPPSAKEHVEDATEFHLLGGYHLHLPAIGPTVYVGGWKILPLQITKFMILELLAAGLILAIYIPLARQLSSGEPASGGWANAFEGVLTFIREDVAKPNLGDHEADRYLPFLWTLFLFVLFCNLLGMLPFMGSPTASIWVTGALAVCAFVAIHGCAVAKMGFVPYLKSLWPHLDIPIPGVGFVINLMICVIEIFGAIVKSSVLAVRLFANMFAGHMVLATILLFILAAAAGGPALWATVTFGSVLGVVALSLLELFVAFLQAYIFVFLTSLFMGMSLHPHH